MHRASLDNEVDDCKAEDRNTVWLIHDITLANVTVYSNQIQYIHNQPT